MFDQPTLRILATVTMAGLGWLVWKLVDRSVLGRAGSRPPLDNILPGDFVPGLPGLLVFGSPDCRTCVSAQKPAVHSLANRLGKAIQILDVDVTTRPELAESYGVLSLPTIFVLDRNGAPRKVNHGFVAAGELHRQLAPYLIA
jgi:hypothetical protein